MTKEIILQTIKDANKSGTHLLKFLKNNCPDVLCELLEQTSFLDKAYEGTDYKVPLQARLYCLEHDLTEPPKCQNSECHSGCTPHWDYGNDNSRSSVVLIVEIHGSVKYRQRTYIERRLKNLV